MKNLKQFETLLRVTIKENLKRLGVSVNKLTDDQIDEIGLKWLTVTLESDWPSEVLEMDIYEIPEIYDTFSLRMRRFRS